MKKLIIIALLLAISVVAQQNMSGIISQPVVGAFTLGAFQYCIAQDRLMLFGPTGEDVIGYNDCFRTDLFEVNGMIADCENDVCNLVTTLSDELQATNPHTSKETDMVDLLLEELDNSTDCLLRVYNGSMFNGTEGEIFVGPKTYFNTVKPCYVRTITALGGLEQIYIDEPNASFFVQKLQALEVDYQQLLTIEDLKASKTFNVSNSTLNGTVEGAVGGAESNLDSLELTISESQPQSVSPQATSRVVTVADYDTVDSIAVPALGKIVVMANMNQPTLSYGPGGVTISADSRFNVIYQNYQNTGQGQFLTLIFTIQPGAMGSSPGYQFTINNAGNNDPDMEAVYVRIDTGNRGEAVGLGAGLENNEGVFSTAGYSQPTSSTTLGVGAPQASSGNALTKYLYFNAAGELVVEYDATVGLTNALASWIVGHNDPDGFTYTGEFDNVNNWLNLVLGSFNVDFVKGYSTVRDTDKDEMTASDIDVAETDVISTAGIAWSMAEYATNDNNLDKNKNQAIPEIQATSNVIFANPASASGASDTASVDLVDQDDPTNTINVAFKVAVSATYDPLGPIPSVTALPPECTVSNLPVIVIDPLTNWGLWSVMVYCEAGVAPAGNTITVTAPKGAGNTVNTNFLFRITKPNGNAATGNANPNNQIALGSALAAPGCIPFGLGGILYTPLPLVGENNAKFTGTGGVFPVNILSGPVNTENTYGNILFAANILSPNANPAFFPLNAGTITQYSSCSVDVPGLVFSGLFSGSFAAVTNLDVAVTPSNAGIFSVNMNGATGAGDFMIVSPTGEAGISSTPTGGFGIENINASPTLALGVAALIVLILFFLLRKRTA